MGQLALAFDDQGEMGTQIEGLALGVVVEFQFHEVVALVVADLYPVQVFKGRWRGQVSRQIQVQTGEFPESFQFAARIFPGRGLETGGHDKDQGLVQKGGLFPDPEKESRGQVGGRKFPAAKGKFFFVIASKDQAKGRGRLVPSLPPFHEAGGGNALRRRFGLVFHPEEFQHECIEKEAAIGRSLAGVGVGRAFGEAGFHKAVGFFSAPGDPDKGMVQCEHGLFSPNVKRVVYSPPLPRARGRKKSLSIATGPGIIGTDPFNPHIFKQRSAPVKPQRTTLSVPGHLEKMHAKAIASNADAVMLDLEDSVPADQKVAARARIAKSLTTLDFGEKTVLVRVNSMDTPFGFRDILELAGKGVVEGLVVPKVDHERQIHCVVGLLEGLEMEQGIRPMTLQACIETPGGLERVGEICDAGQGRITALAFGIADYSAAVGARLPSLSGHGENEADLYPGHRWHFPLSRMVMAAKSRGILALDAPFGNFKDLEALKTGTLLGSALGCDGKWVIHPNQIDTVNQVHSPSEEEIDRARKILAVSRKFQEKGEIRGALAVDGKMVDLATIRLAENLWANARHLGLVSDE